jgi:hypothetical protein
LNIEMVILVACEESQTVCKAFRDKGHEAYSCDKQKCSGGFPEWHIEGDALVEAYSGKYDMMIGHPPCTTISYAGTMHWNNPGRVFERLKSLEFFAKLWEAPIKKICLENPKSCASPVIAKYTQEIQPYYFGDTHLKTTWLWLRNLPPLKYSLVDDLFGPATATEKPEPIYIDASGKRRYFVEAMRVSGGQQERAKARSKTFIGIAKAMAEQWG